VRVAQEHLINNFRALPYWAQTESAAALVAMFPIPFGSVQQRQDDGNRLGSGGEGGGRAPRIPGGAGGIPPAAADGAGGENPDDNGGPGRKLKGYHRPEVIGLDASKRLAKPPSDYTKDQRKDDERILSSALAAVTRGKATKASVEFITETISSSKSSVEAYNRLWPSVRYRKLYALRRAAKYGKTGPEVMSVGDGHVIYTSIKPAGDVLTSNELRDDPELYLDRTLPVQFVPFHNPTKVEEKLDKFLVQSFLTGVRKNYKSLMPHIHLLDSRIALYWLPLEYCSLRWGDVESDIEIKPCKSPKPKHKKRRLSDTSGGST